MLTSSWTPQPSVAAVSNLNEPRLFSIFLTPDYAPFAIAFLVMVGIGMIEAVGLGIGHLDLDHDIDGDIGHWSVLDWLGLGSQIPILIWLTSLLACFSLSGVALQQIATAVSGAPFHAAIAAAIAAAVALVLNGFVASAFARILPTYESTVISRDELVRRRGTILEGQARRGAPARAKVVDQHRQVHYVMVEPHNDGDVLSQGDTGLLVRREGTIFFLLPDSPPALRPTA